MLALRAKAAPVILYFFNVSSKHLLIFILTFTSPFTNNKLQFTNSEVKTSLIRTTPVAYRGKPRMQRWLHFLKLRAWFQEKTNISYILFNNCDTFTLLLPIRRWAVKYHWVFYQPCNSDGCLVVLICKQIAPTRSERVRASSNVKTYLRSLYDGKTESGSPFLCSTGTHKQLHQSSTGASSPKAINHRPRVSHRAKSS